MSLVLLYFPRKILLCVVNWWALFGSITARALMTLNHVTRYFFSKSPESRLSNLNVWQKTRFYTCKCVICSFKILKPTCKSSKDLFLTKITQFFSRISVLFLWFGLIICSNLFSGSYFLKISGFGAWTQFLWNWLTIKQDQIRLTPICDIALQ